MISTGSIEGTLNGKSPVATSFTQSVDPGSGVTIPLAPRSPNQPIFCATAYGDAPALIVLAHHPTRIVVSARATETKASDKVAARRSRITLLQGNRTGVADNIQTAAEPVVGIDQPVLVDIHIVDLDAV